MQLRHLQIFQAVCQTGSFTQAADLLFLTQPAVSHAVRLLEAEAGAALFYRYGNHPGKSIRLTPTGALLSQRASALLASFDELSRSLPHLADDTPIRLGSTITVGNYYLPAMLKPIQQPLTVTIDTAAEISRQLFSYDLDIALIEGVLTPSDFCSQSLGSCRVIPVCAPDFPAARESVTVSRLAAYPLLLREKGSAIRDVLDSALLLHDIQVEPSWTSVNSQALLQAAREGLGIAFLPEQLAAPWLRSGKLVQLPVPELTLQNEIHLVYDPHRFFTPAMRRLIEALTSRPLE